MKFTSRGFTLVELMIVIAIIGILAAALFPSMTNYLKRSRDAARASNMKDISTALGAYYADKESYPGKTGNCFVADNSFSGNTAYFPKGLAKDPQASSRTSENGCAGGNYGYNTGSINGAVNSFQLGSMFENTAGGNTGTNITTALGNTNYTADLGVVKGSGSGYIIGN